MSTSGDVLEFRNIALAGTSRKQGGIKLSPAGVEWVSVARDGDTRKRRVIRAAAVSRAEWCRFGSSCQLKLVALERGADKKGKGKEAAPRVTYRFDGFSTKDYSAVQAVVEKKWNKQLEPTDVASKGGNWGELQFADGNMQFVTPDSKMVLEIPRGEVSQCALPGKNEVEIQFLEDDTAEKEDELLVEMRVYVPKTYGAVDPLDAEEGDEDGKDGAASAAELLQRTIQRKAGIMESSAEAICTFSQPDPLFLTPRGRYEVEIFAGYFRLKGKTYDFKIQYKHVSKFYLLPRPNGVHVAFVISLDEPIRQGKQRYPHLVLQLERDDEREIDLAIPPDEKDSKRFAGLQPRMRAPIHRLMAKILRRLTQRSVYQPAESFKSKRGSKAVKSALKSSDGLLFPLDNAFFFIHKPATHVRFADIQAVEFLRYSSKKTATTQRTFDLRIALKEQVAAATDEYVFTSIDRTEYENLVSFLKEKKIKILNLQSEQVATGYASSDSGGGGEGESSEDSDFEAGEDDSDDEAEDEAAMAALVPEEGKSKRKSKGKGKGKRAARADSDADTGAGAGAGAGSKKRKSRDDDDEDDDDDDGSDGDSGDNGSGDDSDAEVPSASKKARSNASSVSGSDDE